MRGFFTGVSVTLDSAVLLTSTKGYRKFLIIPFLLNILILTSFIVFAAAVVYPLAVSFLPAGEQWYMILLRGAAIVCFVLLLAGSIILMYSLVGCIVAVPFADAVISKLLAGKGGAGGGLLTAVASAFHGVLMILMFFFLNIFLALLNVIPIAGNMIYLFISFFFLIFFIGSQIYDTTSFGKKSFSAKMSEYWSLKWCMCGIGFSFLIFAAIPLFGFLAPVISAAAAAQIRCRILSPEGDDAA